MAAHWKVEVSLFEFCFYFAFAFELFEDGQLEKFWPLVEGVDE